MFVVRCETCRQRRLLGTSRIRAVQNLPNQVIAVRLACYCGEAVTLLTGGGRPPVQVRQSG